MLFRIQDLIKSWKKLLNSEVSSNNSNNSNSGSNNADEDGPPPAKKEKHSSSSKESSRESTPSRDSQATLSQVEEIYIAVYKRWSQGGL